MGMDTKAFKRSLHQSDKYHRRGFGHEEEVTELLNSEYQSPLIQEIRENNYRLKKGNVTIRLAEAFGFCWGVERAVAIAYETRQHFPNEQIWITNEIIHNPSVNQHLRDMNVGFIPVQEGEKDFSVVDAGDVVILPAFGASVNEMQLLNDLGCTIVALVLGFLKFGTPLKSIKNAVIPPLSMENIITKKLLQPVLLLRNI